MPWQNLCIHELFFTWISFTLENATSKLDTGPSRTRIEHVSVILVRPSIAANFMADSFSAGNNDGVLSATIASLCSAELRG